MTEPIGPRVRRRAGPPAGEADERAADAGMPTGGPVEAELGPEATPGPGAALGSGLPPGAEAPPGPGVPSRPETPHEPEPALGPEVPPVAEVAPGVEAAADAAPAVGPDMAPGTEAARGPEAALGPEELPSPETARGPEAGPGGEAARGAEASLGPEAALGPEEPPSPETARGPEAAPGPDSATGAEPRSVDARLARVHLRVGLLALARAELESMAGAGTLDPGALIDLAEVRWRTGDLVGAGEAAAACIEGGSEEPVVLSVAAEAAAAAGRAGDARLLVARVLAHPEVDLDAMFAGIPRLAPWPPPTVDTVPVPAPEATGPHLPGVAAPSPSTATGAWQIPSPPAVPPEVERNGRLGEPAEEPMAYAEPGEDGRADEPEVVVQRRRDASRTGAGRGPSRSAGDLAVAESLLDSEQFAALAAALGVILRSQPALAPAVLGLADAALRRPATNPERAALLVVRGDAYRLMGRERSAMDAFEQAGRAIRGGLDEDEA